MLRFGRKPWRLSSISEASLAAVEQAVLDHRSERIALPVLGLGLDHVHVRREHHRPERRIAPRPGGDQVRGVVDRHDLDVALGPAAGQQRAAESLRYFGGAVAFALHRAQRDRFLGQVEGLGFSGGIGLGLGLGCDGGEQGEGDGESLGLLHDRHLAQIGGPRQSSWDSVGAAG